MFQGFFEFPYLRIRVLKINKNKLFRVKLSKYYHTEQQQQ